MKILFVNPNSTDSMTKKVASTATSILPKDVSIDARSNSKGPASIQGPEDGDAAVPGMLQVIKAGVADGADGVVIACFDDTGLDKARALVDVPVIGIGQAAFHLSMLEGHHFSVVTTMSISIPVIEANIKSYGVGSFCRAVRASEVPVLELEQSGSNAEERISMEISQALAEDGSDAIVLGCAGMTDLVDRMQQRHGVLVIDGVSAASALVHGIVLSRCI